MGRRAGMRRGLAAALLAAVTAGCSVSGPGLDGDDPAEGAGRSVLAVKIDNVGAARPQTGLDAADIVYVEQVEGGLSRLMAVYATRLPDAVGPVRSARESDLELLRQFDEPTLAYSGAQRRLLPVIDSAPVRAETPGDAADAYYRDAGRRAPHNLYLRPERLIGSAPGADVLTTGFRTGPAPGGGTPRESYSVRYPSAGFTFTWSGSRQRWLVSMDGTPTVTTDGERVAAATVVVQYVDVRKSAYHDVRGSNSPYTETVGSGKARVLRDGRMYDVNWERPVASGGTEFTTADGAPVDFAEGQVWVVLARSSG
ncbi:MULTISPECIES: DUF3048 domain-containing protein [Streptomyces]|nr:DUF3048 domain-containing protein [Streptomyces ruber]